MHSSAVAIIFSSHPESIRVNNYNARRYNIDTIEYTNQYELATGPLRDALIYESLSGQSLVSEDILDSVLPINHMKFRHRNILRRCYCKDHASYRDYGAKNIGVDDVWRHGKSGVLNFRRWLVAEGMTDANRHYWTVGRRTPDSNYGPTTCTLETNTEQQRNKSNTAWVVDAETGDRVSLIEYCEITGENYRTACKRYRAGKPLKHPAFMKLAPSESYEIVRFTEDGSAIKYPTIEYVKRWLTTEARNISSVLKGFGDDALGGKWRYMKKGDREKVYKLIDGKYVECPIDGERRSVQQ